jgi:hypothetical protein
VLSRRQRVISWIALVLLGAQAPVAARFLSDESWLFSVVVAGLVAVLIIADDVARRPAMQRSRDWRGPAPD